MTEHRVLHTAARVTQTVDTRYATTTDGDTAMIALPKTPTIWLVHQPRSCTSSLRLIRQTDRPGTIIPSLLYLYEGLLPWSPISFSTSWG